MGIQLRNGAYHYIVDSHTNVGLSLFSSPEASFNLRRKLVTEKDRVSISRKFVSIGRGRRRRNRKGNVVEASNGVNVAPFWNDKASSAPCLSDVFWPSAGAFAAMAILGKMDQILAPKGISITIAPLGAVSTVLFATPSTPAARKYNMFMAQIGCAAIGVVAFSIFGPGWFAKSSALAASIAFMIYTRSIHPPAASLPLLFIDGAKFHNLKFWYAFFPGAAGCILLCFIVMRWSTALVYMRSVGAIPNRCGTLTLPLTSARVCPLETDGDVELMESKWRNASLTSGETTAPTGNRWYCT